MRSNRLPHPLRSALMIAFGTALIIGPVALDLGAAAMVTAMATGVIAVALGFAGTAPEGRGTLPGSVQSAYDRGLALGLLLTALVFASGGEMQAVAFFAATGIAVLLVSLTTRYGLRHT